MNMDSLHLFSSSLISLFVRLVPNYFIFEAANVNGIVFNFKFYLFIPEV